MGRIRGNPLELGIVNGKGVPLSMTPEMRSTHLYICGATRTGKSKMLESLIRQDIKQWHDNHCGALIIDPHGGLYNGILNWITWNQKHLKDIPIVPIDLSEQNWTVGYNVMRTRAIADPSVVISNFVQAMAYVWGVDGTQTTPLFARICKEVLWPLYEKGLTLLEAEYMVDRTNKLVRSYLTEGLANQSVSQSWAFSNSLSPKDFDAQVSSTVNRFNSFLHAKKLRLMFGQDGASLDLAKAIEDGQIIIANLSTKGARVSEEDASLFATLLLSDLWTAAKERGKDMDESDIKPFYVYIDEFQNFVTPTIAKNLDQARGFGLHLTLANQFPRQILHTGANGQQVYESVMTNARSKIVFSLDGSDNLRPLAESLFMGVIDPDAIKLKLFSTKVMDYVEEERVVSSTSENWSDAEGAFAGTTDSDSLTGAIEDGLEQEARIWNTSDASSSGNSRIRAEGGGSSESKVPFLRPILGQELSSVQFRTVEEQVFMAMQTLSDQAQRHGVARLVGMRAPLNIVTPDVQQTFSTEVMTEEFLQGLYKKLPFALPSVDADRRIDERRKRLLAEMRGETIEPMPTSRKVPRAIPRKHESTDTPEGLHFPPSANI